MKSPGLIAGGISNSSMRYGSIEKLVDRSEFVGKYSNAFCAEG